MSWLRKSGGEQFSAHVEIPKMLVKVMKLIFQGWILGKAYCSLPLLTHVTQDKELKL